MISAIFTAWLWSKPLQWLTLSLLLLGGYEAWKLHERNLGAAKVEAVIQQKADDNAALADRVRENVTAGRIRGRPDPYGVRP